MRYKYQSVMKDGNGKIISGGTITVYLTGTSTLASVYTASSGGTAVNSVTSDTEGYFYFWVDDSDYTSWNKFKVVCSKTGFNSKTYGDIRILPETDAFYPDYSATNQGVTGSSNTLKYYVDTIGSDTGTIILRHNSGSATTTYTLTTSETISADKTLIVEAGVLIDGAGTLTFAAGSHFEAGGGQCFGSSITVVFPEDETVRSSWWSGTSFLQKALDSLTSGGMVIHRGDATIVSTQFKYAGIKLVGEGILPKLTATGSGNVLWATGLNDCSIRNIQVYGSTDESGIYLNDCDQWELVDVLAHSNNQQGVFLRGGSQKNKLTRVTARSNTNHGIKVVGKRNYILNCLAEDNAKNGFYVECETVATVDYTSDYNIFESCRADSNDRHGFNENVEIAAYAGSVGPSYNSYVNCHARENGGGQSYSGFATNWKSVAPSFVSCHAQDNIEHGFAFQGQLGGVVAGCVSISNDGNGFMTQDGVSPSAQKTYGITFTNIYASANGGGAISGREDNILFLDTTDQCQILGGFSRNATEYGIKFDTGVTNCSVKDLLFSGNGTGDINNTATTVNPITTIGAAIPAADVRGKGDVHINTSTDLGKPTNWVCTVAGTPGTWVAVGQIGYRTNAGSPSAALTPRFVGEEVYDTTNSVWYKSIGTGATNWVALN